MKSKSSDPEEGRAAGGAAGRERQRGGGASTGDAGARAPCGVQVVGLLGDGVEAERGGASQELALPAHHVQRLRRRGFVREGVAGGGDDPSGGHASLLLLLPWIAVPAAQG